MKILSTNDELKLVISLLFLVHLILIKITASLSLKKKITLERQTPHESFLFN